jgi:hypothetical protein
LRAFFRALKQVLEALQRCLLPKHPPRPPAATATATTTTTATTGREGGDSPRSLAARAFAAKAAALAAASPPPLRHAVSGASRADPTTPPPPLPPLPLSPPLAGLQTPLVARAAADGPSEANAAQPGGGLGVATDDGLGVATDVGLAARAAYPADAAVHWVAVEYLKVTGPPWKKQGAIALEGYTANVLLHSAHGLAVYFLFVHQELKLERILSR